MGAENQQERLIQLGWVIGFVDGEGCFSIGFVRQPMRAGRKGCKTGYQVFHEMAVTQGAKSVSCLHELVRFFGVGSVIVNRRDDNHKEHLYRYVVRRRADLIDTIISFFKSHPMHSSKQRDFEKFACCVEMIDSGVHLSHSGLADIAEIVETMNRQKPKSDLIKILRGHTPEVQDTGS
jgi:LAGLIDADG endonuclease